MTPTGLTRSAAASTPPAELSTPQSDLSLDGLDLSLDDGKPAILRLPGGRRPGDWLADNADVFPDLLARFGAVLVRGSGISTPAEFARAASLLVGEPMVEREGFAPRDIHPDGVYSGSKWPADQPMCMHHELSYALDSPGTLLFGCLSAPDVAGATALADAGKVLAELPEDVVTRFDDLGWILRRQYNDLVGVSWTEAFGVSTRAEVEQYCANNAIDLEWADDGLRTRQHRSAIVRHPQSGQPCWFNQIAFLSQWTMDPDVRELLVDTFGADSLPFDTDWGNGDPIDVDLVTGIHRAYEAVTVREPWQAGDLLLVDNIATAHSRDPYEGQREVLVAMGAPMRLPDRLPATNAQACRP